MSESNEETPARYTVTCSGCARFGAILEFFPGTVGAIVWEGVRVGSGVPRADLEAFGALCPPCAQARCVAGSESVQ